jgi:hypothetical protein
MSTGKTLFLRQKESVPSNCFTITPSEGKPHRHNTIHTCIDKFAVPYRDVAGVKFIYFFEKNNDATRPKDCAG